MMDRKSAETLTKVFLQLSSDLNAITYDYMSTDGDGDPAYLKFRDGVGRVLGTFYTDIMMQVFRDFPDLEPEELRDNDDEDEDEGTAT
jgi:hypothetical protein